MFALGFFCGQAGVTVTIRLREDGGNLYLAEMPLYVGGPGGTPTGRTRSGSIGGTPCYEWDVPFPPGQTLDFYFVPGARGMDGYIPVNANTTGGSYTLVSVNTSDPCQTMFRLAAPAADGGLLDLTITTYND